MIQFVFYFFIFLTLASAFALLFVRQILYAVLLLLVVMLCVAGLFILMQAEFIGVSQILIYAGGVAVLFIFGIMLSDKKGFSFTKVAYTQIFSGMGIALVLGSLLLYATQAVKKLPNEVKVKNDVQQLSFELLSDFALPFEVTGILLLSIFIGMAYIAGKTNHTQS